MADFSGPAEEFLYLIIPCVIHFVSQVTNVETVTKTSPMEPRNSMRIQPLLLSRTVRPGAATLTNRTSLAFPCHFFKVLIF